MALDTFNSTPIHSLAQLARAADTCAADNFVFEFLRLSGDGKELVVLDRSVCVEAENDILVQHLIASPSMVRCSGGSVSDLRPSRTWVSASASPAANGEL